MNTPMRSNSTLALFSLIFGILGWTLLPFAGSLVAIVTGHMARAEIRRSPETLDGDGLAVAGMVLGYVVVGLSLLAFIFILLIFGGIAGLLAAAGH
ncbi:DUF4190 domain-containing protein [Thermomonas sp.]|uniref:DUF4190 domain-containing protein n=1 Tax=Thermomonas sp. TaxID=1971895 RepID=UPI0026145DAD|nr:DUF4190 domain-containing protein [Thermomonas sp.]MCO5055920.1 DUF4190 domain-containing protein [Thermomonas sp.]